MKIGLAPKNDSNNSGMVVSKTSRNRILEAALSHKRACVLLGIKRMLCYSENDLASWVPKYSVK